MAEGTRTGGKVEIPPVEETVEEVPTKLIRLDIGSGGKRNGWKTLDIDQQLQPDIVDDATKMTKIPDEGCQEIYASHILEHIPENKILGTLKIWRKKLAPGGRLIIYVPDVEEAWRRHFNSEIGEAGLHAVMVGSNPYSSPYQIHKTMFWFSRLLKLVYQAGFRNCVQLPARPGTRVEFGIQARREFE